MSDLMNCDRCQRLFNTLESISRYDDSGRISLFTRICEQCQKESGLVPTVYSESETMREEEVIQEAEPDPSYLVPGL